MNESLLNRILKDHKRRTRSLALILCLSMIVSLGTFAGFHKNAIAKVYTREVLDCPYAHEGAEPVAHVHNDDCYEGETLVCTLPELEAHTHTEECFAEQRRLTCGSPAAWRRTRPSARSSTRTPAPSSSCSTLKTATRSSAP